MHGSNVGRKAISGFVVLGGLEDEKVACIPGEIFLGCGFSKG